MSTDRSSDLEVAVQNLRAFEADDAEALEAWLREVVIDLEPRAASLGVRFVDDDEMSQINERYRQRATTTDVLSFSGEEEARGRHVGDVVISLPRARVQAREEGHELSREVRLLLLHGILHCLGWDHETDDGEMAEREYELRERWLST